MELDGLVGIETYNVAGVNTGCRGMANIHLDDLMAAGRIVWGLATDDRHEIDTTGPQAWIEVRAGANDRVAILDAMRRGLYYSTTGPKIHDIAFSATHLTVECSEARRVTFSTLPWLSKTVAAAGGPITKTLVSLDSIGSSKSVASFTKRLIKQKMLSAPKEIKPHVRVEIDDGRGGGFAWSNPISIVQ